MNKPLTPSQHAVVLDYFIHYEYEGWRNIAEKLITDGVCIVAGDHNIWNGSIGNFIKTKKNDSFIGCLEYTFDLEEFLKSEFFQITLPGKINCKQNELDNLGSLKMNLENQIKELNQLKNK